eukprot:7846204-Ditylum_brightwellii.AAC.1
MEKFESLNLTKDDVTMMSLEIKNMCPTIQFGMKNTLVGFQDKYFNYKGTTKRDDLTVKDVALAIVGYISAFLADLVASYLLEMMGRKFIKAKYKGIYRDNGLTVLVGKWNKVVTTSNAPQRYGIPPRKQNSPWRRKKNGME